jgi:hypothetical protein
MRKLTITEGLAEIKLATKKMDTHLNGVLKYSNRSEQLTDPLEKRGGSVAFVKSERQAISDLQKNIIGIRIAINKANMATPLVIEGESKTVAEWLIWRREVSNLQQKHNTQIAHAINVARTQANSGKVKEEKYNLVVNLDEKELHDEQLKLDTILSTLDGKLSMHNAVTIIEI